MISLNQISSRYYRVGAAFTGIAGLSAVVGLSFSRMGIVDSVWLIMGVTFVSLLLLSLVFMFFYRLWRRKKGDALSKMLRKDAGSVELSGIESIRTNFENGVEKLRKANRNVYDLPWFLLAGQAGAGKTEAIRRSHAKEDFPPGLNDLMQGVGGTLNMNWWFTNKGIILDTAGRIFEERVQAGQNNEWQEFLRMLKKARKNMPINGFILAIPADSLIRDDFAQIEQKASHIAEQITLVQNILGVRFPVFILITKADYIPGFREFVENITEPQLQQQMLGWSNPAGLDEPFEAEKVEDYLDGVIKKLKKRRLTYLLDPRPQGRKRLDDLDSLFTFPNQLRTALPNLKRYIEIVFSLNPWTQKPLFIRGIYFTSSLQQGDALDEALAEVMGKNLKEMALSSFKKEVPLFLRDVFFQKIYREQGLVTTASKVKGTMRRNAFLFAAACLLGVGLILAASWIGSRSFSEAIGEEYVHWSFAAEKYDGFKADEAREKGQFPLPVVSYDEVEGKVLSKKNEPLKVSNQQYTLPEYIERMATFAKEVPKDPLVFRPFKFIDDVTTGETHDRDGAFRQLYEDAIIFPVIYNAREELQVTEPEAWTEHDLNALNALIRLQLLLNLNQESRGDDFAAEFWAEIDKLFFYLTKEELGSELKRSYEEFFSPAYVSGTGWPNESFSKEYYAAVDDLSDPSLVAISHGLDLWIKDIGGIQVQQTETKAELEERLNELRDIGKQEEGLLSQGMAQRNLDARLLTDVDERLSLFEERVRGLSGESRPFKFQLYFEEEINGAKERVEEQVGALIERIKEMPGGGALGQDVLSRVGQKRIELISSFDEIATPEFLGRLQAADVDFLSETTGMRARLNLYHAFVDYQAKIQRASIVDWKEAGGRITALQGLREEVRQRMSEYSGYRSTELEGLKKLADEKLDQASLRIYSDYSRLIRRHLGERVGFPILRDSQRIMTREELSSLGQFFGEIGEDIENAEGLLADGLIGDSDLLDLVQRLRAFNEALKPALSGKMAFQFLPLKELRTDVRNSVFWRARIVHLEDGGGRPVRMSIDKPVDLGSIRTLADRLQLRFTSTVDSELGDAGGFRLDGGWVPLRLFLEGEGAQDGKRVYRGRLDAGAGGGSAVFKLSITSTPELPLLSEWPQIKDLEGR